MKVNLRLWNNTIGLINHVSITYINAMGRLSVSDAEQRYKQSRHKMNALALSMIGDIKSERQAMINTYDQNVTKKREEKVNVLV